MSLQIPGGTETAVGGTALVVGTIPASTAGRICGRAFSATNAKTATIAYAAITQVSVCSEYYKAEREKKKQRFNRYTSSHIPLPKLGINATRYRYKCFLMKISSLPT